MLTGRDADGRLWVSPLTGPAGFLAAHGTTLDVHAVPGGPLRDLPAGQQVGPLAIEFEIRRRMRVNGLLSGVGPDGLTVEVEEAFGNCPSYIQQRTLAPAAALTQPDPWAVIRAADTFFLGTTHPTRGADASHKGGPAGFVRVADGELWWPDYAGNNMFNSMGNIEVDSETALLFVDFAGGAVVYLSGRARLEWVPPAPRATTTARVVGSGSVRSGWSRRRWRFGAVARSRPRTTCYCGSSADHRRRGRLVRAEDAVDVRFPQVLRPLVLLVLGPPATCHGRYPGGAALRRGLLGGECPRGPCTGGSRLGTGPCTWTSSTGTAAGPSPTAGTRLANGTPTAAGQVLLEAAPSRVPAQGGQAVAGRAANTGQRTATCQAAGALQ